MGIAAKAKSLRDQVLENLKQPKDKDLDKDSDMRWNIMNQKLQEKENLIGKLEEEVAFFVSKRMTLSEDVKKEQAAILRSIEDRKANVEQREKRVSEKEQNYNRDQAFLDEEKSRATKSKNESENLKFQLREKVERLNIFITGAKDVLESIKEV